MGKELIKKLLREFLSEKVIQLPRSKEASEKKKDDGDDETETTGQTWTDLSKKEKQKVQTLTTKIRNATQGPDKILKLSQVGQAAGVIDASDASDRSKLGKEVSGEPDADGKVRHLRPDTAAKLGKVVDNVTAYTHASPAAAE